jgi:hypothetical protein
MGQTAILFPNGVRQQDGARAWLARAAQARRIAPMLGAKDSAILEAYASECEAQAHGPTAVRSAIAA